MSAWNHRGWVPCLLAAAIAAGLGAAAGCGKKAEPTAPDVRGQARDHGRCVRSKRQAKRSPPPSHHLAQQASNPAPAAAAATGRDRLHQSFAEATVGPDNPPADAKQPADKTITGKSAVALYEQVMKTWDSVKFTTADGKKIDHVARSDTTLGVIEMAILPELAPNHARNFIVLAKLGYYDGLRFDRVHYEKDGNNLTHCIEAGCPLGHRRDGRRQHRLLAQGRVHRRGTACSHTEGVVGAFRLPEADTAATKFYVNVHPAPFRDGYYSLFGKVIEGLGRREEYQ